MGESLTYPFEPEPPGWEFEELLDAPEDEFARPQDTLLALKAVAQAEAMLHARRLQLMQQLRVSKAGDEDGEWTADLVAVELNISIPRAQREVGYAGLLTEQLPETLRLLGAGKLDAARARRVSELTVGLTAEQKTELEQRIYPHAADLTPRRLTSLVKRHIIAIDPHTAQQQATAARAQRRVSIEPAEHGMSWLNAYLPSEDANAVYGRIDSLARRCKGADDERTMDQARADVLRDLILGKHGTGSGTVTTVYVTATAETLLGMSDLPGELRGYGPLPAEQIRELAYRLNATWSGVLVDEAGYPKKLADKRYRFQGKLAEYLRLRDPTCTFPGCNKPAEKCDLDHIIPHPEGETTAENGAPGCRRHHRLKTHSGWTTRRQPDGSITWTGPLGEQLTHRPEPLTPARGESPRSDLMSRTESGSKWRSSRVLAVETAGSVVE